MTIENSQKSKRGGRREGAGRKRNFGRDVDWDNVRIRKITRRVTIPSEYFDYVRELIDTFLLLDELQDGSTAMSLRHKVMKELFLVRQTIKDLPKNKSQKSVDTEQNSLFDYCQKSNKGPVDTAQAG